MSLMPIPPECDIWMPHKRWWIPLTKAGLLSNPREKVHTFWAQWHHNRSKETKTGTTYGTEQPKMLHKEQRVDAFLSSGLTYQAASNIDS